jgi:hypothetical protein
MSINKAILRYKPENENLVFYLDIEEDDGNTIAVFAAFPDDSEGSQIAAFDAFTYDDDWGDANSLAEHIEKFTRICNAYLNQRVDVNAITRAFKMGFEANMFPLDSMFPLPNDLRRAAYIAGYEMAQKFQP